MKLRSLVAAAWLSACAFAGDLLGTERQLAEYRSELARFRAEFGGARAMPDAAFYQFGMGARRKLLFKAGQLVNAANGTVLREWAAEKTVILSHEHTVALRLSDGSVAEIVEDETGVKILENGRSTVLEGTQSPLKLPRFEDHRYGRILRVLHHEILINIIDGQPVPNFYVYRKPWLRDGAMMAMCLQKTGNLDLIRGWIAGLREPYDRNNNGETEADNLGQALYLASLHTGTNHPVVVAVLRELPKWEVASPEGIYIKGRSDFAEHPVYQTKWLKFGLRALGLPDKYIIPKLRDSYSSLFWMDYREAHVPGAEATDREKYPYLGWATDHFQNKKLSPISNRDYPLTWETDASQANYAGMNLVDPLFAKHKTSAPHTWHAAEIFLYLLDN